MNGEIIVSLGKEQISVNKEIYIMLFGESVIHALALYEKSLAASRIPFKEFVELARKAEIPYTLFFAKKSFVQANIDRQNAIILAGVSKGTFSMNSRGSVELRDIKLIVKDLLRKQSLLKKHNEGAENNVVIGSLTRMRRSPLKEQAFHFRDL